MSDFLKFVDRLVKTFPVHVKIYYSKTMDWCITITKAGCASDYPGSLRYGDDAILVNVQDSDVEMAFAKAHMQLKNWLREFNNGY